MRLSLIPHTGCRWAGLIVIMAALMAGGFSNAYAVTYPEMVLIDGDDPESVPDFCIGKYEVTLGQYLEYNAAHNNYHTGNDNYPVETVSWYDAADYCNWLSSEKGLSPYYDADDGYAELGGVGYRLPTEKEYYKAAAWVSGDTYTTYGFGRNDIDGKDANYVLSGDPYDNGYTSGATPVGYYDDTDHGGTFETRDTENQYGLYDMSGNVWEWNNDWHDAGETSRVGRGGGWHSYTLTLVSLYRGIAGPDYENHDVGFRVASSIPEPSALLLFSLGVLPLFWCTRRKRRN